MTWQERVFLEKRSHNSIKDENKPDLSVASGRTVGVKRESPELSWPDRRQLPLLGGEVQGTEQAAARPSQSRVRRRGPDGHVAAELPSQQNRVTVSM